MRPGCGVTVELPPAGIKIFDFFSGSFNDDLPMMLCNSLSDHSLQILIFIQLVMSIFVL